MPSFRQQYKCKTFGFANVKERRFLRAEKKEVLRKNDRTTTFNENRYITNSVVNTPERKEMEAAPEAEDRMARLVKWKEERERRKKIDQVKKKPPFVVGVVHHKVYSPLNKDDTVASTVVRKKVCNETLTLAPPSPAKRVTRATEKRLKNKALAKAKTKIPVKTLSIPHNTKKEHTSPRKQEKSFAPTNHKFQAPVGLNHIPLFGRVPMHSMSPARLSELMSISTLSKTNRKSNIVADTAKDIAKGTANNNAKDNATDNATDNTKDAAKDINVSVHSPQEPVFFSPYVVSSRGKSNARKEQKVKRGFSLGCSPSDNIPTKETVMKNLNISVDEEERTAQYFQFLLNREIDRLYDLCNKWTEIKEEPETTEDGQYEINQAIGQTNLLINKKFERFRRLVADCETGRGEMLVTCKDLQGFWDMMYMEINNCDSRFEKLEKLRSQGWVEEEIVIMKPIVKKKTAVKKKIVPKKTSSIRAFLAEKKKKAAEEMKNNDNIEGTDIVPIANDKHERKESPSAKYKTRRSISIGPNNNVRTPAKSDRKFSLLQKVQLSETSKKIKSPLTIIKVSQMCKTPEVQLDDTISYVNSDQTPGKSILKQPKNASQEEARAKSMNKVNFDDHIVLNEVPVDEDTQTKMDLAAALARIDSLDFGDRDEEPIKAERKLVFDDNSSDESEPEVQKPFEFENYEKEENIEVPLIKVQAPTPLPRTELIKSPSMASSRRRLRRQNAVDESYDILDESMNNSLVPFKEITDAKDLNILKQKLQKHVSMSDEDGGEQDEGVRVLRNRTITAIDTPKARRRSSRKMSFGVRESEQKENKTPSDRRRKKSSLKTRTSAIEKVDLSSHVDNLYLEESSNKRRSTRNVKFSDKECSGCLTNKPPLPVTPHVRRSKVHSTERKRGSLVTEDLISLNTLEKPPGRVRRSQFKEVQSLD